MAVLVFITVLIVLLLILTVMVHMRNIVITPDFDNFTAKLIAADKYSKYMTEIPILEGVTNREYYGRSATSIENKCKIEYGTEQGLAALIYGEKGLSSLPIQDITGEHIDTDNEYMYYYSVEFVK